MGPIALRRLGRQLAAQGRGSDTQLVHVNDEEIKLLLEHGGSGKINPKTGLREFDDAGSGGGNDGAGGGDAGGTGGTGDAGGSSAATGAADAGASADATGASDASAAASAVDSASMSLSADAPARDAVDAGSPATTTTMAPDAPDAAPLDALGTPEDPSIATPSGFSSVLGTVGSVLGSLLGSVPGIGQMATALGLAYDTETGHIQNATQFGQEAALGIPVAGTILGAEEAVGKMLGVSVTGDTSPLSAQTYSGDSSSGQTTDQTDSTTESSLSSNTASGAYLARGS